MLISHILMKMMPKDSFALSKIYKLVDATIGHELLSFMNAFSGYNQIQMHLEDNEKASFNTKIGTYFYIVMPFGIKNKGGPFLKSC